MNESTALLSAPLFRLGASTVTLGGALALASVLLFVLLALFVAAVWRAGKARATAAAGSPIAAS